jgi:signal transduction histidine kinase
MSTAVTGDAHYETARRLLVQLRALSGRLSFGLDPVGIGEEILTEANRQAPSNASVVLARTDSKTTVPVAYQGPAAADRIDIGADLVERCWVSGKRERELVNDRTGQAAYMTALALRVGSETTAVLVTLDSVAAPSGVLHPEDFNDLALRLETALTFDDIRRTVTTDERHRLAREIHDGVAQELASLGYEIDEARSMTTDPDVSGALDNLRRSASRMVSELRLSIFDLRSGVNETAGLGAALSDYLRGLGTRSHLTVHLSLDETPTRLSPVVEAELFRIAQEAITNARKHSAARNLWVTCRVNPPAAHIEIIDDGRGISRGASEASYGLKIMQERAQRIDACLRVTARDVHRGTRVTVSVGATSGGVEAKRVTDAAREFAG